MAKKKYWIQEIHYVEGVNECMGHCDSMTFLVASKEAPHLCQPLFVDYGGIDYMLAAKEEYRELCESYKKWADSGRHPKGWLDLQPVKFYLNR